MNIAERLDFILYQVKKPAIATRLAQVILLILFGLINGALILNLNEWFGKYVLVLIFGLVGIYAVMIIGNLRKALLAIILIDIPLRWDIYLGERTSHPLLGMREGWIIALTTMALGLLFLLYLVQELLRSRSQPRLLFGENVPLLGYLGFTVLSTMVAKDTTGALFQIFFLAQMYFLYVYLASTIRTPQDILFILFFLLAPLAAEGMISILQRFVGLNISLFGIVTVIKDGRAAGTLGSPNVAAGYFSLLLAPALSLLFMPVPPLARLGGLAAFGLGGIALVLTISRGGWISFAVSIAIFLLALWLRGRMPTLAILLIVMILTLVLALFGSLLFDSLVGIRSAAALSRISLMQIAYRMIESHPLLGVGANNYAMNIRQYTPPGSSASFLYVVHNKFLLVWAETGLGGILSFIAFLGISIYRGWKTWQRNDPVLSILALAFSAAIIGQVAHMMVEIFDARTQIQALWLVAAMQSAMERMTRGGANGAT